MKFILTSNAYTTSEKWSQEFGMKPNKMTAAFIDTAAEIYNKEEAGWLKQDRQSLVDAGFTVTDYTLTDKTKDQLKTELKKIDLLFVSCGNTFYLLEKSNNSGFTELIQENFFSDTVYVGSSAGSVLMSNDLDAIKFLDDPKKASLQNFKGIGVLGFTIFPHWGSESFKTKYIQAIDYAYEKSLAALLLNNNQYVVFADNIFSVVTVE